MGHIIEKFIEELGTKYTIREIAFTAGERADGAELEGMTVVPFGQGFVIFRADEGLMRLTLGVCHGGYPVLRWMMDNISYEPTRREHKAGQRKVHRED